MSAQVVPILRVSEASAATTWYRRLGFEPVFEHRFEPGLPVYVGLRRDSAQIHLSEHTGDANPHGLVYIWVDDIDAVAAEFGVATHDQPWAREVQLTDPDGNRLRVAERLEQPVADEVLGEEVAAQLIELERAMWSNVTRGDRAWMGRHLSDGFTEFGWSGQAYTRDEILEIEIGVIEAELDGFHVRPVGSDGALVTYRSVQPRGVGNRTSLWVRRGGRWLLEFHQATPTDS